MTTAELAVRLPDGLDMLAERIEAEIGRSGSRGISPARAARAARCSSHQARQVIAYLVGHQYATASGGWNHVRAAGQPW